MGVPPNHPFYQDGSIINHPAIGIPKFMETSKCCQIGDQTEIEPSSRGVLFSSGSTERSENPKTNWPQATRSIIACHINHNQTFEDVDLSEKQGTSQFQWIVIIIHSYHQFSFLKLPPIGDYTPVFRHIQVKFVVNVHPMYFSIIYGDGSNPISYFMTSHDHSS